MHFEIWKKKKKKEKKETVTHTLISYPLPSLYQKFSRLGFSLFPGDRRVPLGGRRSLSSLPSSALLLPSISVFSSPLSYPSFSAEAELSRDPLWFQIRRFQWQI
ncbi:hypothetical protein YC2023_097002 [Brassica napus]